MEAKDLAGELFRIHSHAELAFEENPDQIVYKEKDVEELLVKLGHPKPDWAAYARDYVPEGDIQLDEFHTHEVIDRISIINHNLEDFVANHPVVSLNPEWKKKVEDAQMILGELYQEVASKEHDGETKGVIIPINNESQA